MKKILIGICATTLLAASAASFAGTITYVNRYNSPVTFVVQPGNGNTLWNAWQFWNWNSDSGYFVSGTVLAGQSVTVSTPDLLPSSTLFTARPTNSDPTAHGCGVLTQNADSVFVIAGYPSSYRDIGGYGYTNEGSQFSCRAFVGTYNEAQPVAIYHHHHHTTRVVSVSTY